MTIKIKCNAIKPASETEKSISFSSTQENISGNLHFIVTNGSPADTFEVGEEFYITFQDVIE